jgi:hypothetical protein
MTGECHASQTSRTTFSADAAVIWGRLPEPIQAPSIARAAKIEYPIAAAIAISIASFLHTEALGLVDCKPGRGQ